MTPGERPTLWIVAGPNGSGKSSLYGNTEIEAFDQSIWIINPDLLTLRIQQVEKLPLTEANIEAVTRIEAWLEASIRAHQTVGVETVLSTDSPGSENQGQMEAVARATPQVSRPPIKRRSSTTQEPFRVLSGGSRAIPFLSTPDAPAALRDALGLSIQKQ